MSAVSSTRKVSLGLDQLCSEEKAEAKGLLAKLRLSFFHESVVGLAEVRVLHAGGLNLHLRSHGGFEVHGGLPEDEVLGHLETEGRASGQAFGPTARLRQDFILGDDPVVETDAMGLCRVDEVAGHQKLHGPPHTDQAG